MSKKIKVLEDKLQNEINESDISSEIIKCDHCDNNASTRTVLKRHNILKHKGKVSNKEKKESDIPLTLLKKASMKSLTIPPFK